jgi:hypothetical protein
MLKKWNTVNYLKLFMLVCKSCGSGGGQDFLEENLSEWCHRWCPPTVWFNNIHLLSKIRSKLSVTWLLWQIHVPIGVEEDSGPNQGELDNEGEEDGSASLEISWIKYTVQTILLGGPLHAFLYLMLPLFKGIVYWNKTTFGRLHCIAGDFLIIRWRNLNF